MASSSVAARTSEHAQAEASIESEVRRLLARELHDRVAQTLTSMLVDLENFKTEEVGWSDVLREMNGIQDSTRQVLNSLRQLLYELRGEERLGDKFVDSVGALASRFEQKTSITTRLTVQPGWPDSITPPASVNLYRIIEEALANVRMHSGAQSVRILLEPASERELTLVVTDDGRGLEVHDARPSGMGTVGMKERALVLGGTLSIESQEGDGTTVRATFPRALVALPGQTNNSSTSQVLDGFNPKEITA